MYRTASINTSAITGISKTSQSCCRISTTRRLLYDRPNTGPIATTNGDTGSIMLISTSTSRRCSRNRISHTNSNICRIRNINNNERIRTVTTSTSPEAAVYNQKQEHQHHQQHQQQQQQQQQLQNDATTTTTTKTKTLTTVKTITPNVTTTTKKTAKIPFRPRQPIVYVPTSSSSSSSYSSKSLLKYVPDHIKRPDYAVTGIVPYSQWQDQILLHSSRDSSDSTGSSVDHMRHAAKVAANVLMIACNAAKPGISTDEIDTIVHEALVYKYNCYPSPLNYCTFPKSVCTSINEIICHGIPDGRILVPGDIVSFDVSCYTEYGKHGDNCATVIVGDTDTDTDDDANDDAMDHSSKTDNKRSSSDNNNTNTSTNANKSKNSTNDNTIPASMTAAIVNKNCDWRGVPYKTKFDSREEEYHYMHARHIVNTAHECLVAGINACRPSGMVYDIGTAIEEVATNNNCSSIRKYRGHGISHILHGAPYIKHYKNNDPIPLVPGMIFTIEPMIVYDNTSIGSNTTTTTTPPPTTTTTTTTTTGTNNNKSSTGTSNGSHFVDNCYEWESDNWTVSTRDGSLAAQFEHTVYITESGEVEILTLPDEVI